MPKRKPMGPKSNALRVFRDANNEIISALDQLEHDADLASGAKRASRRQQFRDLECRVDIYHAPGAAPTSCIVPTRDLSAHGLAFLHRSFLHTGSQIAVHLRERDGSTRLHPATIMRCRHVDGMIHEIGAKFAKPIDMSQYVDLEPLRIVMLFNDESAVQDANHQLVCVGTETEVAKDEEHLLERLGEQEYDAVMLQGGILTEELIQSIRSSGYAHAIIALSMEDDDEAALKDRADTVFRGPVSAEVASEVVAHLRAA